MKPESTFEMTDQLESLAGLIGCKAVLNKAGCYGSGYGDSDNEGYRNDRLYGGYGYGYRYGYRNGDGDGDGDGNGYGRSSGNGNGYGRNYAAADGGSLSG